MAKDVAKRIRKQVAETGMLAGMDVKDIQLALMEDKELAARIKALPANQQARALERALSKKSGVSGADINASISGKKPRTQKKAKSKGGEKGQGVINTSARPTSSTTARSQGMLIAKRAFRAMKSSIPFETYKVMTPEQKVQVLISAIGKDKTVVGDVAEGAIIGIQQRIAKFPTGSAAASALEKFGADRGVKSAKRALTIGTQASAAGEKRITVARRRGAGSTIKPDISKPARKEQLSSVADIIAKDAARNEPKTKAQRIAADAAKVEGDINYYADMERPGKPGKPLFGGAPIKFARYEDGKVVEVVDWKNVKNADIQLIASNIGREPAKKGTTIVPIIQDPKTKEWSVAPRRKTARIQRIFERAGKTGALSQKVGASGKLETPVPMVGKVSQKVIDKTPIGERKRYEEIRSARGRRVNREYTDAALIEMVKANQEKARLENRAMLDKINREIKKQSLTPEQAKAAKKAAMVEFHKTKNPIASPAQIARDILGVDDPTMVRRVARVMRAERIATPEATYSGKKKRAMVLKPQNPDEIKAGQQAKAERIMALKNTPGDAAPKPKPIVGKRKATRIGKDILATGTFEGPALRSPRVKRTATPSVAPRPGILSRESILAQLENPADKRQMKKVIGLSKDFTPPQMRALEKRGVLKVSPTVKSAAKNLGMMGFVVGVLSQLGDTKKRRG